jgi:hypothetical protein
MDAGDVACRNPAPFGDPDATVVAAQHAARHVGHGVEGVFLVGLRHHKAIAHGIKLGEGQGLGGLRIVDEGHNVAAAGELAKVFFELVAQGEVGIGGVADVGRGVVGARVMVVGRDFRFGTQHGRIDGGIAIGEGLNGEAAPERVGEGAGEVVEEGFEHLEADGVGVHEEDRVEMAI